jgi:hypothetical protein
MRAMRADKRNGKKIETNRKKERMKKPQAR